MTYIVMALHAEAKALLGHWRFKRDKKLSHRLYRNGDMFLLISKIGYENTSAALRALLAYQLPGKNDTIVNIGLCAAPETYPVGTVLLGNMLIYADQKAVLDTSYNHALKETVLETVETECSTSRGRAVDMEAHAVYDVASDYFQSNRMAFLKIVSDHFAPETVNKDLAAHLIRKNIASIEYVIEGINS